MLEHLVETPEVLPARNRVRIPIQDAADVAVAGEHGRRLASQLEFSPTDVTVITTAILEVARNVLAHAGRGDLLLHLVERGGEPQTTRGSPPPSPSSVAQRPVQVEDARSVVVCHDHEARAATPLDQMKQQIAASRVRQDVACDFENGGRD